METFVRFRLQLILFLVLITRHYCSSEISTANNQFGLKLYSALAKKIEGDFIISPLPLSSLFGWLNSGASGETLREIQTLLQFSGSSAEVASDFRRVLTDFEFLESLDGIKSQVLQNESVEFLESFEESATDDFFIEDLKVSNFLDVNETLKYLQEWIFESYNENSNNYSKQEWVSKEKINPNSSLSLTTKSFFKGSWVTGFNPLFTKPSPFFYNSNHSNQVEMMFQRANIPYADIIDLDCTAISLPYRINYTSGVDSESRIELIILLPNTRTGLQDLEIKLKEYPFSQITRQFFETKDIFVYLPKLSVNVSMDITQVLSELGMKTVFDPESADFSKMLLNSTENPAWVSQIHQFAEFSTDEYGSKGAFSNISNQFVNHYRSAESFRVNRPFIGFIYDQEKHVILNIFRKTS